MIFSILKYDLTIGKLIALLLLVVFGLMIALVSRTLAQGVVAYKCGDGTPKAMGRLTLNPLTHLDPLGFICLILCGIGWSNTMPINPMNFKKYRSGIAWVSISGILTNLVLCIIASFFYVLTLNTLGDSLNVIVIALYWFMYANAFLIAFNILPIYPLDGFTFVSSFMKPDNKFVQGNIKYGTKILFGVLIVDIVLDLLFNFSIITYGLVWIADKICFPFCKLWSLMF